MPVQQTINVIPTAFTSSINNTVITTVQIKGYNQFSPFGGITAQVGLLNASNQVIRVKQIRVTGADWQNWPTGQTEEQDNAYIRDIILTKLGLTSATAN